VDVLNPEVHRRDADAGRVAVHELAHLYDLPHLAESAVPDAEASEAAQCKPGAAQSAERSFAVPAERRAQDGQACPGACHQRVFPQVEREFSGAESHWAEASVPERVPPFRVQQQRVPPQQPEPRVALLARLAVELPPLLLQVPLRPLPP